MNIVQFGSYPLDCNCIRGGVESSVYGLANALSVDHEVDVFDIPRLNGKDTGERVGNIQIHRYRNSGTHNQDSVQRVDEILRDIIALHPDIVHIHGTGEISAIVYQALKEYGFKVLLTVHGLLHVEKKNQLRKKLTLKHIYQYFLQSRIEFEVIENTDIAIVDTEYVAIQLRQLLKEKKVKQLPHMYVIPQGINADYLLLDTIGNNQIILSVGSISERKGHLYLIKAFELVCAKNPQAKLVIAGTLTDQSYYELLTNYIAKSPYKQQIEIKTNLSQEEIFKLYQQATIFALHSQEESQGIVFAEAMAVGLPVVATRVGGVPYVVKDKVTGLLSNYKDVSAFADNMLTLLENSALQQSMARAAKTEAEGYDWREIAKQIERLYQEIIQTYEKQ